MHPATAAVLRFFAFDHLPAGQPRDIAQFYSGAAYRLADALPADPETTVALRKLLESKDAAVRSALGIPIPE